MKRLLSWLWNGHHHDWEIIKEDELVSHSEARRYNKDRVVIGHSYLYKCKVCGNLKRVDI